MEGGNGVRAANVVTLCSKGEIPYCVAVNSPWMAPVPGRLAETRKNLFRSSPQPTRWIGCLSRRRKYLAAKNAKKSLKLREHPPRLRISA